MIPIGVAKTGAISEKALDTLLTQPRNMYVVVRLLDLNHNYRKDLSSRLVDGLVTVDDTADITRALDLTLFDPDKKIHMDPDSPSRTSVFIADMISVVIRIGVPGTNDWYNIPVFCGPADEVNRDDVYLNVKCLGKESMSLGNAWQGRTFKKNQAKVHVIKQILTDLIGEAKYDLVNSTAKLPNDLKLSRDDSPWIVAKRLANSMGLQLFYDGRGVAMLRKKSDRESFTFGPDMLASYPNTTYDLRTVINAVDVIGKKNKKGKKPVKWRAVAPRSHPLSPWRLGRAGVPRYIWMEINDDSLKTEAECKEVAERHLKRGLLAGFDVKFDGVPHPRLQEQDIVRVNTGEDTFTMIASRFTIPLMAGVDSSYGYLRRQKPKGGASRIDKKKNSGGWA